jgi:hypothetical protein
VGSWACPLGRSRQIKKKREVEKIK